MSKYDSPEWIQTPIRAQIREALREVEQIKGVLQTLEHKATQLDEYHQMRVAYAKQYPGNSANNSAAQAKAWKPVTTLGAFARGDSARDLARLDGWMKSLTESEIGLNTMLSDDGSTQANEFARVRTGYVQQQASRWANTCGRTCFLIGTEVPAGRDKPAVALSDRTR